MVQEHVDKSVHLIKFAGTALTNTQISFQAQVGVA